MNLRRVLIGLSLVLTLTHAFAQAADKPTLAAKLTSWHRIGVISSVGHELHRKKFGMLIFQNQEEALTIDDWGLDPIFEDQIIRLGTPEFKAIELTRVSAPREQILSAANLDAARSEFSDKLDPRKLSPDLGVICQADSLDAMLVVTPHSSRDYITYSKQQLYGLGVFSHQGAKALYLNAALSVIDCTTHGEIARAWLGMGNSHGVNLADPYVRTRDEYAMMPFSTWSEQDRTTVRGVIVTNLAQLWGGALKAMLGQRVTLHDSVDYTQTGS